MGDGWLVNLLLDSWMVDLLLSRLPTFIISEISGPMKISDLFLL